MSKLNQNTHPSDVAIYIGAASSTAACASFGTSGDVEIVNLPLDGGFHVALANWRASLGFEVSLQTVFRLAPLFFTEQTRVAAIPEDVLWEKTEDAALTEWLINAALQDMSGTNGKKIFESSLDKSAYDFVRLRSGEISLTELPKDVLRQCVKQMLSNDPFDPSKLRSLTVNQPEDIQPYLLYGVETRLRAVARSVAFGSEREYFEGLGENETVAFVVAAGDGYGFALWSGGRTFYFEAGEVFHADFDAEEVPSGMTADDFQSQRFSDAINTFLYDHFYPMVDPEAVSDRVDLRRIYWVAADEVVGVVTDVMSQFSTETSFACSEVPHNLGDLVVMGLLLGTTHDATEMVPGVNLANDIASQQHEIAAGKQNDEAGALQKKRMVAVACILLPILLCVGIGLGMVANNWRRSASLSKRETVAKKEKERLTPVLKAREEYEKTLGWYQEVIKQITGLRRKQMSSIAFAARLDPLYPQNSFFYISDMKVAAGGAFELKGLCKDEAAVAEFVRTMEVAGDDNANRFFKGLTVEFKQGSKIEGAGAAGSGASSGTLAPGVVAFSIKGVFGPASELKAQQGGPAPVPVPAAQTSPAPATPQQASNSGGGK